MHIRSSELSLEIDDVSGVVRSLRANRDPDFELAGTPANTSYESWRADSPWLGDVLLRVWDGSGWREELTWRSGDTRKVSLDRDRISVDYSTPSKADKGIAGVALRQSWAVDGAAINWTLTLTNTSTATVEVGELAAAFLLNMDYAGIFKDNEDKAARSGGELQRQWHEERVQQHLHISGNGSYGLYQRPSGLGPVLFVGPLGEAAWEAAYQIDPELANQWSVVFEGPYWVALHSRAARVERRWLQNRQRQNLWVNGNSSLILAPGESREFAFQFAVLDDLADVRKQLVANGQLAVEVVPGPAVPVGESVKLLVAGDAEFTAVAETGNIAIERDNRNPALLSIRFDTPGEKDILIRYGGSRWTRIFLYGTATPAAALDARAEFIIARQQFRNPDDPFGRDMAFMPYDHDRECIYLGSEEAWQTGASDEYGIVIGMYLAEKNVHRPVPREIGAVDDYIDQFLLNRLQSPETLEIRRGMFHWPEQPSRIGHEWTAEASRDVHRYNNYPLAGAVYYAMYRIARVHGGTRRTAAEYLSLTWRTLVLGFEIGITKMAGAPAGAFQYDVLEDLARDDPEGYHALEPWLRRYADHVRTDAYPYGSELYIDQTAHAQVYMATAAYGTDEELSKVFRVTRAMRAGYQPTWFRYGNDERGSVCCWYGTPQNSEVLLRGFERTGNLDYLQLAQGGLSSFLTCLMANGGARGWFTWWPDRTGFDPRSLDTDLGLFNHLRAAKSYVVTHPVLGLTGYGCAVEATSTGATVRPWDGVNQRLWLEQPGLDISATGVVIESALVEDGRVVLLLSKASPFVRDWSISATSRSQHSIAISRGTIVLDEGQQNVSVHGSAGEAHEELAISLKS